MIGPGETEIGTVIGIETVETVTGDGSAAGRDAGSGGDPGQSHGRNAAVGRENAVSAKVPSGDLIVTL